MALRHLLSGLSFAIVLLGTPLFAQEPDEAIEMLNVNCEGYGVLEVGFAEDHAVVILDGQSLTLPYEAELPGEAFLYANDTNAMVLDGDDVFIGPRVNWGGSVLRPVRECAWEA